MFDRLFQYVGSLPYPHLWMPLLFLTLALPKILAMARDWRSLRGEESRSQLIKALMDVHKAAAEQACALPPMLRKQLLNTCEAEIQSQLNRTSWRQLWYPLAKSKELVEDPILPLIPWDQLSKRQVRMIYIYEGTAVVKLLMAGAVMIFAFIVTLGVGVMWFEDFASIRSLREVTAEGWRVIFFGIFFPVALFRAVFGLYGTACTSNMKAMEVRVGLRASESRKVLKDATSMSI